MKLDLSNLIKTETWTEESFKAHLRSTLVELIKLELENLPREDWERTLRTWRKICAFCAQMKKRQEQERFELYKRFGFDPTMVHISESVVEKLRTAQELGLMKEGEPPDKIIRLGLEALQESSETAEFIKRFFA